MYSHMMVGSNDIERSKKFYDATFKAIGGREGIVDPKGRLMYLYNNSAFLVTHPIDGQPATAGNGCTVGFSMTPEQANAWHKAGVEAGGTAIEDRAGFLRALARGERWGAHARKYMIDAAHWAGLPGPPPSGA